MKMDEKVFLGVLTVGMLCGTKLLAQEAASAESAPKAEQSVMEKVADSPMRLGVDLIGLYTDNRDSVPKGDLLYESTFDFVVRPRIAFGSQTPTQTLAFEYAPSLRYRSNPNDLQNDVEVLHDLGLRGEWIVDPTLRLRVSEKYDYTDDSSVQKSGVTIRENRSYSLNRLEGGLNYRFGRWSDVDVFVRHMMKKYNKSANLNDGDRESLEGNVAVWKQVARNVGLQGSLKALKYQFDQDADFNRDFQNLQASARMEIRLNPTLRGSIALGVQQIQYDNDDMDSTSGPYAALEIRGAALPVLNISAELSHGIREADVWPFSTQEYDQLHARVAWDASAEVTLGCNTTYRISQYDGEQRPIGAGVATPGASTAGDEITFVASLDATYKMGEKTAVTLAQIYEDVNSDVDYSFTKNTTTLSYSVSF